MHIFEINVKLNKRLQLSALFVLFAVYGISQQYSKGYIITHKSDTIEGVVKYNWDERLHEVCVFRTEETREWTNYAPSQIKGYGMNERVFNSQLPDEFQWGKNEKFIEYLVEGTASLFYAENYLVTYRDSLILFSKEKKEINYKGDKIMLAGNERLKNSAAFLVKDCFDLISDFNSLSLNHPYMTSIITDFNRCRKSKSTSFYEPEIKLSGQLLYGVGFSSYGFNASKERAYLNESNYVSSPEVSFSGRIKFQFPQLNNRISFFVEGKGGNREFASEHQIQTPDSTSIYTSRIKLKSNSLWIGGFYQLPWQLEFYLGMGINFIKEVNQLHQVESLRAGTVEVRNLPHFEFSEKNFNWQLGVTKSIWLSRKSALLIDLNYAYGFGYLVNESSSLNHKTHQFLTRIGFSYYLGQ